MGIGLGMDSRIRGGIQRVKGIQYRKWLRRGSKSIRVVRGVLNVIMWSPMHVEYLPVESQEEHLEKARVPC